VKIAVQAVRIFVGVLFIISGLVKANDPLGLAYKMQEFFEVWNVSLRSSSFFARDALISFFSFMHGYALALSIIMITLEILAGVALLIGWRKKFILNLLLLLILFFTFLTAYAYGSGKFKNCGCFGDCIPISPLTSLIKDLVLLAMILFLLFTQRFIRPYSNVRGGNLVMLITLVFTLALQWYVLNFLPVVDCLPFKIDNNIPEKMKPPVGSVPDSVVMRFIYEKNGKREEFSMEDVMAGKTKDYKYVDRFDKVVRKGNADPAIKGFVLNGISGTDSTDAILQLPEAILVVGEEPGHSIEWMHDLDEMKKAAEKRNVPVYFATTAVQNVNQSLLKENIRDVPVFGLDFTVVKTIARTNPTVLWLKNGTIVDKYGYREFDKLTAKLK
jgi:uncharacterized membrane protein YphA (DoxX/SURF4 family)